MDPQPFLWEAAQALTRGLRNNVFAPDSMRGYVLWHHATEVTRDDIITAMAECDEIFWRTVGSFCMMTPLGSANLWTRYGKPSPRNKAPERQNATSRYFAHVWKRLMPYAQAYLAKKLPRSAELGKIDDHIMGWVGLAIERNYLAKYLDRGNIAPSLVCHFMYNKACSDLRKDGRDPSCRALHGALAPHEVLARNNDGVSWTERVGPMPPALGEDPLANISDTSSTSMLDNLDQLDLEQMSSFIATLLSQRFENVNLMEIYETQFDLGLGPDETARRLNVPRATVQSARKEVGRLIRAQRGTIRTFGASV